ncbi:MAG TPA: HNH endonuclease [Candidatus Corynebacterium avicola]|uniref:HNH endonuclease n=1 Tax=Candidatus Corynebacterium avicola TaxID=2838527 RepID=A0A9D1RT56_9CORY|nr:HNH endonuclease [Candidatus Corynebacterium avicola]
MQVDRIVIHERQVEREEPEGPFWATGQAKGSSFKSQANMMELLTAISVTPDGQTEVSRHIRSVARQLGVSPGKAQQYCDIGIMYRHFPAIGRRLTCGAFSFDHLRVLADATAGVSERYRELVDAAVAQLLAPVRARQTVPGVRTLARMVRETIADVAPLARPVDPEGEGEIPPPQAQLDFAVDERSDHSTTFVVTVPVDEGTGVVRMIDAVADQLGCSRAQAFVELVHGRINKGGRVNVTLNCYRNLDTGTMHLESAWLSEVATKRWISRVTSMCVAGHSEHTRRHNSDHQRATIAGRDGTCRAPGCDAPAATAEIDHVARWTGEFAEDGTPTGGKTATWAEQSLCTPCHSLKTRGLLDVRLNPDGSTCWTSHDDGHQYVDLPTGPLANAVLDFSTRLHRKVATREEHNRARLAHIAEVEKALQEAEVVPF